MKVSLVRHPAPFIEAGICYGRLDVAVHPMAEDTIDRIAADPALGEAARVWTSPARRCQALARAIAHARAVPMMLDDRLLELDFGRWEGRPWAEVPRTDLEQWAASPLDFVPPGGESARSLIARIRAFDAMLRHSPQSCVVVSHGGPLKVLAALLKGKPIDLLAAPPAFAALDHVFLQPA